MKNSKIDSSAYWLACACFALVTVIPARADEDSAYPTSRFGRPPMTMKHHLEEVKAKEEADNVDRMSRSPAGLRIGEDAERDAPGAEAPGLPPIRMESTPEMQKLGLKRKGVQEISVIAGDLGFFPRTVFVNRDIPVRLFVTGASKNTLCIMLDAFLVHKQVKSQRIEEITFTPKDPGNYRFYCPINGMEGHLVVREISEDRSADGVATSSSSAERTPAAFEATEE